MLHENIVGIASVVCLLGTMIIKEITSFQKNSFSQRLSATLNILIAPLLIVLALIIINKIITAIF